MANNPLGAESILGHMAEALPTHAKGDTNSDISSSYEAIALFAHACMTAVGFRLLGFGEGQNLTSELQQLAPRLSTKWNSSFGSHAFLYAHTQSSMQYVIKIDRMGGKAEIRGLGLGDERIARFEIVAKDYISSASLPLRITLSLTGDEDRSSLPSKLKDLFISPSRLVDLTSLFKTQVIQPLLPSLHKEGYEESASSNNSHHTADQRAESHAARNEPRNPALWDPNYPQPARPYPFHDPLSAGPRRPIHPGGDFAPPGFDDEYDIQRGPLRGGLVPGSQGGGFGIGHDDLNPPGLGPHDPLRGSFVGGGPGGFGGGMHPTFDDPLFGGQGQAGRGRGGGFGNAPPGARYDPLGPSDGPIGGRGGNGRPPNPFGGFGDNDFI